MDLQKFNQTKFKIISLYEALENIHTELGITHFSEQLLLSKAALLADTFNVVVVGEFSRGKSTFINALLGQKILPSSTRPTTTVINKIHYDLNFAYNIYFRDGTNRQISEEEFQELIVGGTPDVDSAQEMELYEKHVEYIASIEYVDIAYPLELCQNGIDIIDTPGTNDTDREEITFKFIPQADVAILILSATQIFSDSEKDFLKNRILANDIQKIFFVINFKDRLASKEEEDELFDYATKHLESVLDNPRIYLVSSRNALNFKRTQSGQTLAGKRVIVPDTLEETGFAVLEDDLAQYLITQRATIKFQKYIERGLRICSALDSDYIQLQKRAILVDLEVVKQKVAEFKPRIAATKNNVVVELNRLLASLAAFEKKLVTRYRMGLEHIARAAIAAVDDYTGELNCEQILRRVENVVAPLQTKLHEELTEFKKTQMEGEIAYTVKKLNSACDNLIKNFQRELEISTTAMAEVAFSSTISMNDELYQRDIRLFKNFMIGGAIIGVIAASHMLVPIVGASFAMFNYFKYEQKGEILQKLKQQVNKKYYHTIKNQLQEFRSQYKRDADSMIQALQNEIGSKITSFDQQLKDLLLEKEANEVNNSAKLATLQDQSERIVLIQNQLKELF